MSEPCPSCGYIHASTDARAIGRFGTAPTRYVAAPAEPMGRWAVVTDATGACWVRDEHDPARPWHDPARPWQGRQSWDDLVRLRGPLTVRWEGETDE